METRPKSFDPSTEFRVTLASIGDGVISTDAHGKIRFMNAVAERLTGWPVKDAAGRPLEEVFCIVNEFTRERVENPVAKVQRTGHIVGLSNHTILIARDGTERPVDDSGAPVRDDDGRVRGVVLVFRDVAAQRSAERAARWTAAIVEHSIDAIVGKDLSGRVTSWNPAAARVFGYTAEEMIGEPITRLLPADRQSEEQEILTRIRQGERVESFETVRVRKDGSQFRARVSISPVKDREGHVIGASKIARDVTREWEEHRALVAAQQELERHAQTLEARVQERTAELEDKVADLEAFSYSLSHDLRAPLRTITSFTQIVLEDRRATFDAETIGHLERVVRAGRRMDRLIEDVLLFSRLSRRAIAIEPVNVEKIVDDIIAEQPELQSPQVNLQIDRPLLPVRGHGALVTQCLTNLIDNAVKFVAAGAKPWVRVYTEPHGDTVRLGVEDNGIGISRDAQRRLFGLFQKLHPAEQYAGTGVGLAIVKKATDQMHGSVGVESEPGKGSRFWIQLPKT